MFHFGIIANNAKLFHNECLTKQFFLLLPPPLLLPLRSAEGWPRRCDLQLKGLRKGFDQLIKFHKKINQVGN